MGEQKRADKPKKRSGRLTPREYRTACQMWESGEYTVKQIAEQYGIRPNGLGQRFRKDGIIKGAEAASHDKAVAESLKKDSAKSAAETRKIVSKLQENHLTWLDQITKRTLVIAARAAQENLPLGSFKDDVKVLKDMSDILAKNYGTAATILRIDQIAEEEENLPTFVVQEMSADDVKAIRDAQIKDEAYALTGHVEGDDDIIMEET